jgi:hypothetical protein
MQGHILTQHMLSKYPLISKILKQNTGKLAIRLARISITYAKQILGYTRLSPFKQGILEAPLKDWRLEGSGPDYKENHI